MAKGFGDTPALFTGKRTPGTEQAPAAGIAKPKGDRDTGEDNDFPEDSEPGTRALVLRTVDYTNTSQILTLLTPDGVVSAYARGSRRKNNHLHGPMVELTVLDMVLRQPKSGEGLSQVVASTAVYWPRRTHWCLAAYHAAEFLREVLLAIPITPQDAGVVMDVVRVEIDCLSDPESACRVAAEFSAWMLRLNGLQPELGQCVVTGRKPSGKVPVAFSYAENGLLSPKAAAGKAGLDQLHPGALALLQALFSGNQERIDDVAVQSPADWLTALRVSTRLLSFAAGREFQSLPVLAAEVRREFSRGVTREKQ